MGRFFALDSPFTLFMTKVADFAIITIFTVLLSLPLLTIGPALTAMFYVALKLVRDEEGYIVKSYFKAFVGNFVQSFLAQICVMVFGWIVYFLMEVVYKWTLDGGGWPTRLIYLIQLGFCVVLVSGLIYLFPLIARFKNRLIFQFKNAIMMAVKHVPQTILMLIVDVLLIFYTIDYPFLWIFDVGIIGFANSMVLASIFKLYMPKENAETAESTNEAADEEVVSDETTSDNNSEQ